MEGQLILKIVKLDSPYLWLNLRVGLFQLDLSTIGAIHPHTLPRRNILLRLGALQTKRDIVAMPSWQKPISPNLVLLKIVKVSRGRNGINFTLIKN